MKIKWNKIARRQWQGAYKGFDCAINPIGESRYQYLIWDVNGKLLYDGIEKKWRKALKTVKTLLKGGGVNIFIKK